MTWVDSELASGGEAEGTMNPGKLTSFSSGTMGRKAVALVTASDLTAALRAGEGALWLSGVGPSGKGSWKQLVE